MAAKKSRRAVLVLPDLGLHETSLNKVKSEFQNSLVSSLGRAGAEEGETVVVVVVVVYSEARELHD